MVLKEIRAARTMIRPRICRRRIQKGFSGGSTRGLSEMAIWSSWQLW